MQKSSVQGWQTGGHDRCPCNREHETTAWHVTRIKHLHKRLVTVHGLDFGIPAEMTAFKACPGLCRTARDEALEQEEYFVEFGDLSPIFFVLELMRQRVAALQKHLRRPAVLLAELVHSACRIDKPLLARIKWMAS